MARSQTRRSSRGAACQMARRGAGGAPVEVARGPLPGDGLTLRSPIFQHVLHDRKGPEALASGASEPLALDGRTPERQEWTGRRGGGRLGGGGGGPGAPPPAGGGG